MAKFTHGGRRKGAGRKSVFGQKTADKPIAMCFTPAGHRALRRLQRATKLSRNGVIGLLAAQFAPALVFTEDGVAYPHKGPEVLSIRLPRAIGQQLRAARKRTGKSYSDLGERLVRSFGPDCAFASQISAGDTNE